MHTVETDANRRGAGGAVVVNLRKFNRKPAFGERCVIIDGEDQFDGTVIAVYPDDRIALVQITINTAGAS